MNENDNPLTQPGITQQSGHMYNEDSVAEGGALLRPKVSQSVGESGAEEGIGDAGPGGKPFRITNG